MRQKKDQKIVKQDSVQRVKKLGTRQKARTGGQTEADDLLAPET